MELKMKTLLLLLLLSTSAYSMSLTDQLIMESRIQNQLQQQQSLGNFEQSLRLQDMESKMRKLERERETDVDDTILMLWIIQNRPDLVGVK